MFAILTTTQIDTIALLSKEYKAKSSDIDNNGNNELIVVLKDANRNPIRRIYINKKGQVTHIQVV